MIVVHGLVTPDGRLACWAESTDAPALRTAGAPTPTSGSAGDDDGSGHAGSPSSNGGEGHGGVGDGGAVPYPVRRRGPAPHPFAVVPPVRGELGTADLHLPASDSGTAAFPATSPTAPLPLASATESLPPRAFAAASLPAASPAAPVSRALPAAFPAASPELAGHLAVPGKRGRRAAARRPAVWTVPIVYLPPGADLEALLGDARAGSSVGYLADLAAFAADLVARGRVLPTVTTSATVPTASPATASPTAAAGTATATRAAAGAATGAGTVGPEARWRPALWGADAATFEALCRAMPGVAAAARVWSAQEATRAALHAEVDALVRARLLRHPLVAEGQVRQDGAVRAWLAALTAPDARLLTATARPPDAADPQRPAVTGLQPDATRATGPSNAADPQRSGVAGPSGVGVTDRAPGAGGGVATGGVATGGVATGGVAIAVAEVERLREVVEDWAGSGRPAAVRTCFRLTYVEEFPEDETDDGAADAATAAAAGGGWLVEFLLQPADEPGLLVPAEDVWADAASPLFRWVDYPQDVLLADLGRASRLWPELDEALRQPRPVRLRLDTVGAHRFLTYASLLHDAGFGVLLPAQWQRRQELGLTLTVRSRQPAVPVLRDTTANREAIVGYRWGLAIGDEFLSEADLVELARAKVPLVRLRGRWVHLDRDRLRAGLAFLARGGRGEMTAGEAMRLTRLVPDGALPLPVTGVDGTGWLADLLTGRAVERLELLDEPASLTARLRPYQRRGLSWLAFLDSIGVGALLADDMGLGKTVQVLALEAHLRDQGPRPPTLIVCPLSVLGNWRREIERFTPGLSVRVHHGSDRLAGADLAAELAAEAGADLVLTTYQVATRDVDTLAATAWDRVVLDEAQQVKNATGVTARAMRRIPARHRVALTGTPVENRLTELWSIADFLNPGLLGEASIFRARYSVPVERYGDADAAGRLRRVTRPFLLRRVKTDRAVIADLPEKFERRQWCNLTREQATLYRAVVDELFVKLREGHAGAQRKGLVLSAMTKLKQVCNHPAHLMGDGTPLPGRSGKLARLEEILAAALDTGDRALVFTQFAKFGHMLVPHLAGRLGTDVAFLHGGTPKGARDAMVERFQSGTGPGVLLLSLKAGGTGLNLTAANHVVHVDRWWNPATEAQATDRAFRIGQRRDVQVHTFVCIGTIEERVEQIMVGKRNLAGVAVGSGEGWLTGLSTDDLLDLMTLAPEAVEDD